MPDTDTVVVTGAARGIGLATARAFLESGWAVVAGDRSWAGADDVRSEFEASGRVLLAEFDATDRASVEAMATAALDRFGRVDALVNNVALRMRDLFHPTGLSTVLGAQDSDHEAMFRVNVLGTLAVTRAFVPPMLESGRGGAVVMISAIGTVTNAVGRGVWEIAQPTPENQPYEASKSALNSLSFSLAREVRDAGVTVNVVFPGPTQTTGSVEMAQARASVGFDVHPMLRPEHVAPVVVHLAQQRGPGADTGRAYDAPLWNAEHGLGDRSHWLA